MYAPLPCLNSQIRPPHGFDRAAGLLRPLRFSGGLKHLISSPCIEITVNDAAESVPRKLVALPMFESLSVKNIVLRLKGIDFNHRDK